MIDYKKLKPTKEQWKFIKSEAETTLGTAGPGAGKTLTLAFLIRHLTRDGVPPERILAFTFTKKAAAEMQAKLNELCPGLRLPWLGTCHAVARRILHESGAQFQICDSAKRDKIIDELIQSLTIKRLPDYREVSDYISRRKGELSETQDGNGILDKLYRRYQKRLAQESMKDFDDLLRDAVALLTQNKALCRHYQKRFQHILIDEAQDLTPLQWQFVQLLKGTGNRLFCIGDDDQVLYGWRGVQTDFLLKFKEVFPGAEVFKITENRRSTAPIVRASGAFIRQNTKRIKKKQRAIKKTGAPITVSCKKNIWREAEYIATEIQALRGKGYAVQDIMVLARQGRILARVRKELEDRNIDCDDGTCNDILDSDSARLLLDVLRLLVNRHNDDAFKQVCLSWPGIGQGKFNSIAGRAESGQCSLYRAANRLVKEGKMLDTLPRLLSLLDRLKKKAVGNSPSNVARKIIRSFQIEEEPLTEAIAWLRSCSSIRAVLEDADMQRYPVAKPKEAVRLMTIHAAKGLEARAVFLMGWEDGILPDYRSMTGDELEEERRAAYVGMTRAKDRLYISYVQQARMGIQKFRQNYPSRFVSELKQRAARYCHFLEDDALTAVPVDKRNYAKRSDFLPGEHLSHVKYSAVQFIRKISSQKSRVRLDGGEGIKVVKMANLTHLPRV